MTFNLTQFLAALALLWIPLPFSLSEGKLGLYHERVESPTLGGLLRTWQNWVDLLRAGGGIWLLLNLSINPDPADPRSPALVLQLQLGLVLIGVVIQTFRLSSEVNLFAPLFYLTSLTLILGGTVEGSFAVICGWTMAIGTRDFRYLLPITAVGLLLSALAFQVYSLSLAANLLFVLLPVGVATLFHKRLWFLARQMKRSGRRVLARVAANPASAPPAPCAAGRSAKSLAASAKRGG
jgi:hypothetical protein